MAEELIRNKKVAYYHGCFANYYYPEVGMATAKVLRHNGVEIAVPEQVCCGLPMMAKGNISGAAKSMARNAGVFGKLVSEGYVVVATCSSCGLMLKRDYPLLLGGEQAELVSANTYHITEYLRELHRLGELKTDFTPTPQSIFYFVPCHLRSQGILDATVETLQLIPGTEVTYVSNECCGMGGAYGYEKKNYKLSKNIAGKICAEILENPADKLVTECGGCKLQAEAGTGITADHSIILLQEAYNI
ncbi:heterodisulfide reductase-related iron-sulfur binding cluster [Chloroflexota bacterium]